MTGACGPYNLGGSAIVPVSRFMPTRFGTFMINICIYNHPFKVFMNRKEEGVEDLVCGNVGETK